MEIEIWGKFKKIVDIIEANCSKNLGKFSAKLGKKGKSLGIIVRNFREKNNRKSGKWT